MLTAHFWWTFDRDAFNVFVVLAVIAAFLFAILVTIREWRLFLKGRQHRRAVRIVRQSHQSSCVGEIRRGTAYDWKRDAS